MAYLITAYWLLMKNIDRTNNKMVAIYRALKKLSNTGY